MTNEVTAIIGRRRSTRSFKQEQVADEALQAVLDAGRCAPHAGNPCHITVVQNAALLAKINDAAKQAALHMGMPHLEQLSRDPSFTGSYGAPTIIIVSDQEDSVAPDLNAGAATENMLIAAESQGLGACWVHFPLFFLYGPQVEEIYGDLMLPAGNKPRACIALGYKDTDVAPAERAYSEITFIK